MQHRLEHRAGEMVHVLVGYPYRNIERVTSNALRTFLNPADGELLQYSMDMEGGFLLFQDRCSDIRGIHTQHNTMEIAVDGWRTMSEHGSRT